ncbi:MAG: DNA repair protein RecO [Candidatus Midichloria sp.]|uniref:DNA repair protein RecO n=1 Tax=Hyalomma marginatum TaxID=34627 RepID=A0A8S4C234_9ACAR|nr:DNA repair protein RecO [Hyalomma marginatum]CAG7593770.1 DNA repair protein RecO [Hyalomma marginatum]
MIIEDQGIVISARDFEERYVVVQCFLKNNGLMCGLLRVSKSSKTDCSPGNIVHATWNARLREHLGHYKFDLIRNALAATAFDRTAVTFIRAAIATSLLVLHEKEKQIELFNELEAFLLATSQPYTKFFYSKYLSLELCILKAGGFGLELNKCASSGKTVELIYISPKSGAVVSRGAGEPYHDKMLKLPQSMLTFQNGISEQELYDCLPITGYFIEKNILSTTGKKMPFERELMLEILQSNCEN